MAGQMKKIISSFNVSLLVDAGFALALVATPEIGSFGYNRFDVARCKFMLPR
jgi:hypothetical protein